MAKVVTENRVVECRMGDQSDQRAPIVGVLGMLSLAKRLLENSCKDELCESYLDECMIFLKSHDVMDSHLALTKFPVKPIEEHQGITSLIRLLIYIKMELVEDIGDDHCADLLSQCVLRLAVKYDLSHDDIFTCVQVI